MYLIHRQSHVDVHIDQEITQLLTHLQFPLAEPLLQQLGSALRQHGLGELDRLEVVQFALLQEDGEVLEHGLGLARLLGHSL